MRKNIFICIIFAVSISACTEELDKEINIETNSSLYDLSESEALTIAKTFHESVTSEPRTRDNNTAFGIKRMGELLFPEIKDSKKYSHIYLHSMIRFIKSL